MWAVMCVCRHVCHTQAQSCLSTGWALNRCFAWFFGTAAMLAQGGGRGKCGTVNVRRRGRVGMGLSLSDGTAEHCCMCLPPPPLVQLAARCEEIIRGYQQQGWQIIYPDGSSEKHPEVGWVGGYGVFFGDERDTAEFIPVEEDQTNNRGELRAALRSLQGHRAGQRSLICPDSLLVVNGVLGWAQRWRRHKWHNSAGKVKHVDLWIQILELVERWGEEVKWLHIPSHIGIKGNGRADHLADVGRRRSPLLFGRISRRPHPTEKEDAPLPEETSIWGWEENEYSQSLTPLTAPHEAAMPSTPPVTQSYTPVKTPSGRPTPGYRGVYTGANQKETTPGHTRIHTPVVGGTRPVA